MRLAWFTPWPPQASGIAGRSAALVPELARRGHGIDVCVDERAVPVPLAHDDDPPASGAVRVQSAHDFVWRAARHQYDLVVYQIGNSRLHEFIWPYLFRWPGLTVLHDARLHHARGRALLAYGRVAAYRAEFSWNHPEVTPEAAELGVAGFDGAYYYLWPMVGAIAARSRFIAVHARGGADELQLAFPDQQIKYIALGSGRDQPYTVAERQATRQALGLDPRAVVFGVFGALTSEKRVPQVLRAFRTLIAREPSARLVLAGALDPALDIPDLVRSLGIGHAVSFHAGLSDDEFDGAIAAVDVTINLRWPTAVETSGPWLQALAAERPTIIIDLAHQAHLPALDPRSWQPWPPADAGEPMTIAIDILDEEHSLGIAMRRLATDATLRERLGRAGRRYWEHEHSMQRMIDDYMVLLPRAASCPAPAAPVPSALEVRPTDATLALLAPFGDLSCTLF